MRMSWIVLLLSLLAFNGCKEGPSWKSQTYTEIAVKPESNEVQIPDSLWKKIIESGAPPAPLKPKKEEKKDDAKETEETSAPETSLEPLKVYLIERNKGVLKGQNIALSFAAGGGELDLSNYVAPLRGSYYIAFEFMPGVADVSGAKVFFLSNSVLRQAGSERLGSGCDTYFDLTQRFAGAMKKDGFLVNTSDHRDVSALVGTYVFTSNQGGKLHMASLVIKDDEYRALQCRH